MRRKVNNRNIVGPESVYNSAKVAKLMNYIMESGKKNTARVIVYAMLDTLKEKAKIENPIELFEAALKNTMPAMEVRSRRVGGANYQVPREVRPQRKDALSMK